MQNLTQEQNQELEEVSEEASEASEILNITEDHIKGVIETLLFISEKPVTVDQIKNILETVNVPEIKKSLSELQELYENRQSGMSIVEVAGGYRMLSNPKYVSYARAFYKTKTKEKLSKPALESIAIIAYKQPVTRADIELIRGVNSDGVVTMLLQKELIKLAGRKEVAGRPFLYGTTKLFLEYFGLKSLDSLPKLEEFPQLQQSIDNQSDEKIEEGQNDVIDSENSEDNQVERSIEVEKEEELQQESKSVQTDESDAAVSISVDEEVEKGNDAGISSEDQVKASAEKLVEKLKEE